MSAIPPAPHPRKSRKLPPRLMPVAFAFYMSAIMALLMCTVITIFNTGMGSGLLTRIGHAYLLAMPIAFGCVLLVRPLVLRLVALSVRLD